MVDENLLSQLYSARLDELREMAIGHGMSKAGNVEQLRARLINQVALSEIDLDALKTIQLILPSFEITIFRRAPEFLSEPVIIFYSFIYYFVF